VQAAVMLFVEAGAAAAVMLDLDTPQPNRCPFGDRGGWAGPRLSFSSDGGGAAVTAQSAAAGSARIEKRRVGRTVSSE
jgi:hypothetical protein